MIFKIEKVTRFLTTENKNNSDKEYACNILTVVTVFLIVSQSNASFKNLNNAGHVHAFALMSVKSHCCVNYEKVGGGECSLHSCLCMR